MPRKPLEELYCERLLKVLNHKAGTSYARLNNRPEEVFGQETHDFDCSDPRTGETLALEIVELVKTTGSASALNTRAISDWGKVIELIHPRLPVKPVDGKYNCQLPSLPPGTKQKRRQELIDEAVKCISLLINTPMEDRASVSCKCSWGEISVVRESSGGSTQVIFSHPIQPGPAQAFQVVEGFINKELPKKNGQLKPAKEAGKRTVLLVVLDFPRAAPGFFPQDNNPWQSVDRTSLSNIDELWLACWWVGVSNEYKIF